MPAPPGDDLLTLVELLFFAYRDFTAEADTLLAEFGLFRAHHRALHFVRRRPGIRIADLLAILKITKQSLGRVVNDLVAQDLVENRADPEDRRARRLYVTTAGAALADRLARRQVELMRAALGQGPGAPGASEGAGAIREADVRHFLLGLVAPGERALVADVLG